MRLTIHHTTIDMFSPLWQLGLGATIAAVTGLIIIGKANPAASEIIRKITGLLLVAIAVLLHIYLLYLGTWNVQTSLPLQLCSLSGILSGIVLLWRNQLAYELLLYWGIH